MFNNDTVYECNLYSITPYIRVNKDWTKFQNIKMAETKSVATIMVRPTLRKNIYKEIVTGVPIPVYRITRKYSFFRPLEGDVYYSIPKMSAFIKIEETYDQGITLTKTSSLTVAYAEDVKEYIEEHLSKKSDFKKKLYNIFQTAEGYYANALAQNNYSNETEVKSLLKSMKKRK